MSSDTTTDTSSNQIARLPLAAAIVAWWASAMRFFSPFTITLPNLYRAGPILIAGAVLSSSYSEIAGIPLAAFGAAAYFTAFSLALLTAFGRASLWGLFGIQTILMAAFSAWLIYVQYALIHAWCQYCLISAVTTFTLYFLYLTSRFVGSREHRY